MGTAHWPFQKWSKTEALGELGERHAGGEGPAPVADDGEARFPRVACGGLGNKAVNGGALVVLEDRGLGCDEL